MAEQYAIGKKTFEHGIVWDARQVVNLDEAYRLVNSMNAEVEQYDFRFYQWVILTRNGLGQWQETD